LPLSRGPHEQERDVPTQEKIATVEELRKRLDGAKAVVLTEYRGLTVQQLSDLRKQLRAVRAEYKVVKNRLARIAGAAVGLDALRADLKGPTALVISREDPVAVAKTLATFARTNQALAIKAGYVEGQVLPASEIRALSDLPSKEVLRAQIVGAIQGPLTQLVTLLAAPQREIAYVLAERGKAAGDEAETAAPAAGETTDQAPAG
jgi:large subunit ribosomal protein L10